MKPSKLLLLASVALLAGSLSAQDAPQQGDGQAPGQGIQFSQTVGAQYDNKLGFVPTYRVELTGPLVRNESLTLEGKLTNDFAVLGDQLAASLAAHIRLAPLVSFTLEAPTSVTYRVPTDLTAQLAGIARVAISNRQGPMDQTPGWVWGTEFSSTATAALGPPEQNVPYQAAGQIEIGYQSDFVSPDLKVLTTADLSSLLMSDVKSIASLNFNLGSQERSVKLSAETSLYASPGDTKIGGQFSWDHVVGSLALGVSRLSTSPLFDYTVGIGYRF